MPAAVTPPNATPHQALLTHPVIEAILIFMKDMKTIGTEIRLVKSVLTNSVICVDDILAMLPF